MSAKNFKILVIVPGSGQKPMDGAFEYAFDSDKQKEVIESLFQQRRDWLGS